MTNEEIVKWLRSKKVETGSLLCLGCGYEHNCGIRGCAVMRAAADAMENLERTLTDSEKARSDLARQLLAALKKLAELDRKGGVADG